MVISLKLSDKNHLDSDKNGSAVFLYELKYKQRIQEKPKDFVEENPETLPKANTILFSSSQFYQIRQ